MRLKNKRALKFKETVLLLTKHVLLFPAVKEKMRRNQFRRNQKMLKSHNLTTGVHFEGHHKNRRSKSHEKLKFLKNSEQVRLPINICDHFFNQLITVTAHNFTFKSHLSQSLQDSYLRPIGTNNSGRIINNCWLGNKSMPLFFWKLSTVNRLYSKDLK